MVETITRIDHVLSSTDTLDAGMGQVGAQRLDVGKDERDRDEIQVPSADFNLHALWARLFRSALQHTHVITPSA